MHCRICTAVWVSLWEATGSGIRQLRGHGGRGKRIFESRFRVSRDCVSSPFRPCKRTVSAHPKITPRVACFFGFGSRFFSVSGPIFLGFRGQKVRPFSGLTFKELAFLTGPKGGRFLAALFGFTNSRFFRFRLAPGGTQKVVQNPSRIVGFGLQSRALGQHTYPGHGSVGQSPFLFLPYMCEH